MFRAIYRAFKVEFNEQYVDMDIVGYLNYEYFDYDTQETMRIRLLEVLGSIRATGSS